MGRLSLQAPMGINKIKNVLMSRVSMKIICTLSLLRLIDLKNLDGYTKKPVNKGFLLLKSVLGNLKTQAVKLNLRRVFSGLITSQSRKISIFCLWLRWIRSLQLLIVGFKQLTLESNEAYLRQIGWVRITMVNFAF